MDCCVCSVSDEAVVDEMVPGMDDGDIVCGCEFSDEVDGDVLVNVALGSDTSDADADWCEREALSGCVSAASSAPVTPLAAGEASEAPELL